MRFRPFEELFEIPLRNGLTKPKRVRGEGFKMVNMGELFAFPRINNAPMDRVPLNDKEKESSILEDGDLLFARQSLVREGAGQCSIFVTDDEEVCFESHIIRCRLNQEIANPFFYYYFFRSFQGKQVIDAIIEQGAGASGIRGSDLAKLKIPYIKKEIQDEIASQLNAIDDKIELNRQTNQTLEQIAQAIFKSWFVDFDPVRAKIAAREAFIQQHPEVTEEAIRAAANTEGDTPAHAAAKASELAAMCAISGKTDEELDQLSPDKHQQLTTIAALFPDELDESELGEIPKGWGERRMDQMLELAYGKALKKTDRNPGNVPVYGSGGVTGFHNKHLVQGPGIIVGRKGTVGSLHWEDGDFFPIDTVFYVMSKEGFSLEYVFYLLQTLGLENMNTDAAVPGLNRNNVYRLAVAGHPIELVEMYSKIVNSLENKKSANKKETSSLFDIRDSLLPKLLSGQITLADSENTTEAVA